MVSRRTGLTILFAVTTLLFASLLFIPRIPQPFTYHNFADHRSWLGIPNFGDVASNLPFAIFGAMGLLFLASKISATAFLDRRERWPYFFVFLGLFLTAFGSGYYHLHPSNATLLWDRLTMTIAFMGIVAALITERISIRAVLAKLLETFDAQIFSIGHLVSGHTLKHLAASLSGYFLLRMLHLRRPIVSISFRS